ncbi:MAG TPA: VWA domain-containing protein [Spirochaetia bacterium]|nr:VWA domain-containing protein [Spirochaetia bacterium]
MKGTIRRHMKVVLALVLILGTAAAAAAEERIQLAILLDTSNSMDGLIAQAKSQLWKIVNELARAKRNGKTPTLEVALFEYGNDGLSADDGYIRMVSGLTTDLDRISDELFKLTTNGGSEYCGMVIDQAAKKLAWSPAKDVLKVMYVAGNEPFTQGPVDYRQSDSRAARKGIIVNTVFCGPYNEGVETAWKDGADRADGKYMSIDQDEAVAEIATPYDKEIVDLGNALNKTYVGYGRKGAELKSRQEAQDSNAVSAGPGAIVQRSVAKAQAAYTNEGWDLVDAVSGGVVDLKTIKEDELPAEMKKMTAAGREKYVKDLTAKRAELQGKITIANEKRRALVAEEMKKRAQQNTLDEAVLGSVREEAGKKGFDLR